MNPIRTRRTCRTDRSLFRSRRGQSLVEMSLILPLLFTLFFGIFEFGRHFYTRLSVRHAVAGAARYAVTGNTRDDPQGNPLTRAESIATLVEERVSKLNVTVDSVFLNPADGGDPLDVVQIGVTYRYRFSMPGMHRFFPEMTFTVKTAMRNEPYFP